MNRKQILFSLSLLLFFSCGCMHAQEKQIAISDIRNPSFYPTNYYDVQFMGESTDFTFSKDGKDLWQSNAKGEERKILDLHALNPAPQSMVGIKYKTDRAFVYRVENSYYLFNIADKTVQKIASSPSESTILAFSQETNLLVYKTKDNLGVSYGGNEQEITTDGSPNIVYGEAVHRNEFGIDEGVFLNPKGDAFAFYRMDQSMVTDYPLVNTESRIAESTPIKYPMAGMKSHEVTVGIYHAKTKKTVWLDSYRKQPADVAEREMFLTNITWGRDGKTLYVAKLNRAQNHLWLEQYDAETGAFMKVLFEETAEKYVEPEHGLFFIPNGGGDFLWLSERDGWNHLYRYDKNGNLKKQITEGEWMITDAIRFNKKGDAVFFYATKDSPLENNLYGLTLKTGKITRLTPESGTHHVNIHPSGDLFLDSYSACNTTPNRIVLRNNKGKIVRDIHTSADPFKGMQIPTIEMGEIAAKDGTRLYTRLIKPANFDPTKKYPVLVYVYGGPHAQLITNNWLGGANLFFLYLAQQGYLVWTLDSRGSAHRGYHFESAIWHDLGNIEVSDQMDGVRYLKSLPFVDADRIGVDGWSYGGFMTISLVLKNPGVFKVATAGGPVIDWKWYEIMYGERYMGTPQNNPKGYENASVLNYVNNLNTRLMIIHGAQDPTVVWQNSLAFINACIKKNKLVDYFVYPDHEHNVSGKDRLHLYRKLFDYYETFLK